MNVSVLWSVVKDKVLEWITVNQCWGFFFCNQIDMNGPG